MKRLLPSVLKVSVTEDDLIRAKRLASTNSRLYLSNRCPISIALCRTLRTHLKDEELELENVCVSGDTASVVYKEIAEVYSLSGTAKIMIIQFDTNQPFSLKTIALRKRDATQNTLALAAHIMRLVRYKETGSYFKTQQFLGDVV